ncbi:antitoxin Xre-like helix-turn-helix domain-containing protein [Chitinibacteraceae bacterium HSL-7]
MSAQEKAVPDAAVVLTKAMLRAADALGVSKTLLARILLVSPSTVTRIAQPGGQLNPKSGEWDRATAFIRIYRSLAGLLEGDIAAMKTWLTSHNHDLGDAPLHLIETGGGGSLYNICAYLDSYRGRF